MTRKTATIDAAAITSDHLTANSRVLLNSGRIAIHDDCILALQPDGGWVKEPFADHLPQADDEPASHDEAFETPETAAGENT